MSRKQGVMPGFVPGIHDFLSLKSRKADDEPQL
jgi:hypothetical protein